MAHPNQDFRGPFENLLSFETIVSRENIVGHFYHPIDHSRDVSTLMGNKVILSFWNTCQPSVVLWNHFYCNRRPYSIELIWCMLLPSMMIKTFLPSSISISARALPDVSIKNHSFFSRVDMICEFHLRRVSNPSRHRGGNRAGGGVVRKTPVERA